MTDFIFPVLKGFLLMASVIFAVGPQNAMLIRHGLRRDRAFLIAAIFTLCDFLLITLGVVGVGHYIAQIKWLHIFIVCGGAAFLFWFAFKAFHAAWRGGQNVNQAESVSHGTVIATALAVSLLNPGAIIDTVVAIGSVSSKYPLSGALCFGLGAQAFSTAFFFSLAGFTQSLAPWLNDPKIWRVIDVGVGLITLGIGAHLIFFEL